MSEHTARILWSRTTSDFAYDTYDRGHEIRYASGVTVLASAAPEFNGDATRLNPEEAFTGAVSSCHMLTFLAIAARKRIVVDAYEDDAVGVLEKNADGKLAMTRVTLRPKVRFASEVSAETLARLHAQAHANCFIAQSIRTIVEVR